MSKELPLGRRRWIVSDDLNRRAPLEHEQRYCRHGAPPHKWLEELELRKALTVFQATAARCRKRN